MSSSEHAIQNQKAWTAMSGSYMEPAERCWSTDEITWGIWNVPESSLGALGDLQSLRDRDAIELGCGTAYFSAWLYKLGMNVTGVDITPAQLATARQMQVRHAITFPLIQCSAEDVPIRDSNFDLAISEYGASIWCDPYRWIPEAARLLRLGGRLVFLRNSTIATLCMPDEGSVTTSLQRDLFGLHRIEWGDDGSVEFHIPAGEMVRLLRRCGFELLDLIEIQAPEGADTRYEYMNSDFARRWPSEELWVTRKVTHGNAAF